MIANDVGPVDEVGGGADLRHACVQPGGMPNASIGFEVRSLQVFAQRGRDGSSLVL